MKNKNNSKNKMNIVKSNNFINYIKTFRFYIIFIISLIILFHFFMLIQNYKFVLEGFRLNLSLYDNYMSLIDINNTFNGYSKYLMLAAVTLSAFNISLFFEYFTFQFF